MSRAKGKASKKKAAAAAPFKVGQRVKVLGGDYGNARGTVQGCSGEGVAVLVDNAVRQGAMLFTAAQLVALKSAAASVMPYKSTGYDGLPRPGARLSV